MTKYNSINYNAKMDADDFVLESMDDIDENDDLVSQYTDRSRYNNNIHEPRTSDSF